MRESIRVNLYKEVCAITSVLMDPYRSFIRRLHADGRVTKAEMTKLNQHNTIKCCECGAQVSRTSQQSQHS